MAVVLGPVGTLLAYSFTCTKTLPPSPRVIFVSCSAPETRGALNPLQQRAPGATQEQARSVTRQSDSALLAALNAFKHA